MKIYFLNDNENLKLLSYHFHCAFPAFYIVLGQKHKSECLGVISHTKKNDEEIIPIPFETIQHFIQL